MGRKVAIPFGNDPVTCAVRALLTWLDEANIVEGPMFRAFTRNGTPRMRASVFCASVSRRFSEARHAAFSALKPARETKLLILFQLLKQGFSNPYPLKL